MKKLTILIAVLLFMIVPFPDLEANTYSETPYNCSLNANIGVGASISLFGFTFNANAEGNISLIWGNAAYSCSTIGVGCTSGLTCVEFWETHSTVTPPSMGG